MSMFGNIMNKIFHHGSAEAAEAPAATPKAPSAGPVPDRTANNDAGTSPNTTPQVTSQKAPEPAAVTPPATSGVAPAAPAPASAKSVDVGAVLDKMAASHKNGGGNYRTSIVDLLKLLDMDSSLSARKELADELNVHSGADGSAEENIALHKAVMQKLAENGGVVPHSLRN